MGDTDRSLTYAKNKIKLARLDPSEILPGMQSLTINNEYQDLCMLQLNADVMQHLTEGQVLTIRGNPDESAVVCTDSKTYELKEAETSNSLLLLPNISWPEECENGELRVIPQNVCGIFHNYFELRSFKPSFKKLRTILEANAYRGNEYEDEAAENHTFEDLLDFIQSSKEELLEALENLQTCIVNGYVRILDFDYKFKVLNHILDVIESKSFPSDKIVKKEVVEALQDLIPKEIVEKCFIWFTHETEELDENGDKFYAFEEDSVCRIFGIYIIRTARRHDLGQFFDSWQKSVPNGLKCDLEQLRGVVVKDMNYSSPVLLYFPCDDMPEKVADRFAKLFKVKEKWTYDEIVPYLEDRAYAGNDVKSLLIKYTRESTKGGVKLYSSKW